jgi:hypothetical protein
MSFPFVGDTHFEFVDDSSDGEGGAAGVVDVIVSRVM